MDDSLSLVPLSSEQLALALQSTPQAAGLLVVDVRPSGQFCSGHILGAESLNFSNILLRRLLKGVVKLEAMLTSPELIERVCRRRHATRLVLCDSGSSSTCHRPELLKHAEVFVNCLRERDAKEGLRHRYTVQYVDGGYPAFSQQCPELCEQASPSPASQVHISVSASLPISLQTGSKRKLRLQSAPIDDSDRYGPPVEILPHLMLGCARDSADLAALQRLGVTAVLNVSHNCPSPFQSQLRYMEIRVPDTYQADLLSRLDEAFEFIDSVKASGGRVLVHCHAGVSRSATVCMAYVMKSLGYDLRSAYDFVKTRRPCVSPNLHFMGQLLEFERRLGSHVTSGSEVKTFSCNLASMQEECERPCSLPMSWVSKEKRRAVSTPSSLELYSPSPKRASPVTHRSIRSPCVGPPIREISTSLPATPVISLSNHNPLPSKSTAILSSHSHSLQSLTLLSPCRMAAQNSPPLCHRPVTESL